MRPRAFLPGNSFDLPGDGDREPLRIREGVGDGRPNRPDDVISVERFLRRTGDLDFRPETEPTGFFSVFTRDAIRQAQRRNRRPDTGRIARDDEMLDVIADEAAERERSDRCKQLQVDLANLQIELDERSAQVEQASTDVAVLTEEAEELNQRHDLQLVIAVIAQTVPAIRALRAGRRILATLRDFVRGVGDQSGGLVAAANEAREVGDRLSTAIEILESRLRGLERAQNERRQLLEQRRRLDCERA